jgi:hypothetical protein
MRCEAFDLFDEHDVVCGEDTGFELWTG